MRTQAQLRADAMITTLNTNQSDAPWSKAPTNVNNGYPILMGVGYTTYKVYHWSNSRGTVEGKCFNF